MSSPALSVLSAILLSFAALALLKTKRSASDWALPSGMLVLACLEACDGLSLRPEWDAVALRRAAQGIEAMLSGLVIVISLVHGRMTTIKDLARLRSMPGLLLGLFPPVLLAASGGDLSYAPDLQNEGMLFLENAGYWFYLGTMAACIVALVHLEATFAATRGDERYRVKYESIGIMSILAVLIFYYSQGLLYRTINMNLLPVRSGVFVLAALLISYSRTFRGGAVRVSVSRHIYYRSAALLAVGAYLTGLGLAGEALKYFGGAFEKNLAVFFAFAAGIMLLVLLASAKMRRLVAVLVNKHFFAQKYDYRHEWLRFTERLAACSTVPETQKAIVEAYRETFGLAGAALYVRRRDGGRLVRAVSMGMPEGPEEAHLSAALAEYCAGGNRVVKPADGEYVLSTEEQSFIDGLGARLIVPLLGRTGMEGIVAFGRQLVPAVYTYEDYDVMKSLARQAAPALADGRLSEELAESREMAAVARISSFVVHDLKNLTGSLSLLADNAREHMENPEFQRDALKTMRATVLRMQQLIQRLKSPAQRDSLQVRRENIDRLSRETVAEIDGLFTASRVRYAGTPVFAEVDGDEIKKVIANLVHNAIEASGPAESVAVETGRENGTVLIRVTDAGCGMTESFLQHQLFKPFRTTKGKGLGIGLYQSRRIVESHGGRIDAVSREGKGSVFTVRLPSAPDQRETLP